MQKYSSAILFLLFLSLTFTVLIVMILLFNREYYTELCKLLMKTSLVGWVFILSASTCTTGCCNIFKI